MNTLPELWNLVTWGRKECRFQIWKSEQHNRCQRNPWLKDPYLWVFEFFIITWPTWWKKFYSFCWQFHWIFRYQYAGLYIFTDANVSAVYTRCNLTKGEYPCMDGLSCYTWNQICDDVGVCSRDKRDEMGCEYWA